MWKWAPAGALSYWRLIDSTQPTDYSKDLMLLDYHEIDPSPMASQQEKWLKENAEIVLFGMTLKEFDEMDAEAYACYLANYQEFDL